MSHTCHSQVFSSEAKLLTLLESIAEVPHRKVTKRAHVPAFSSSFFFSQASTIMNEVIKCEEAAWYMGY